MGARSTQIKRFNRNPLRKRSRTIPLKGTGEDNGKYYECWNCGFTCNKDRDPLGGKDEMSPITYAIAETKYACDDLDTERPLDGVGGSQADGPYQGIALTAMSIKSSGHVVLKTEADGTVATVRENYYPSGGSGCPFCHTMNWRGDH